MFHVFWPLTTQQSPSRTADVRSDARSEPAFGSEKPWHQMSSPRSMRGSSVRFCSSVPCSMIAGAMFDRPSGLSVPGACDAVHLLGVHDLLHDARARGRPTPRARRSRRSARRRACGSTPGAFEPVAVDLHRQPPRPSPAELVGEVGVEPGAELLAERLGLRRVAKSISRSILVTASSRCRRARAARRPRVAWRRSRRGAPRWCGTRPSTLSSPMMWTSPSVSLM